MAAPPRGKPYVCKVSCHLKALLQCYLMNLLIHNQRQSNTFHLAGGKQSTHPLRDTRGPFLVGGLFEEKILKINSMFLEFRMEQPKK